MGTEITTELPGPGNRKDLEGVSGAGVQVRRLETPTPTDHDGAPLITDPSGTVEYSVVERGEYPWPEGKEFDSLRIKNPSGGAGSKGDKVLLTVYDRDEPTIREPAGTTEITGDVSVPEPLDVSEQNSPLPVNQQNTPLPVSGRKRGVIFGDVYLNSVSSGEIDINPSTNGISTPCYLSVREYGGGPIDVVCRISASGQKPNGQDIGLDEYSMIGEGTLASGGFLSLSDFFPGGHMISGNDTVRFRLESKGGGNFSAELFVGCTFYAGIGGSNL